MNADLLLTLAIMFGALLLFVWNKVRVDVVGLIVMATLMLFGLVTPSEGISGFANEAVVTVAAMFVLSAGLIRTGAIDRLGLLVARVAGESELRLLAVSLAIVVVLSAFINNTPVVVLMIPVIIAVSRKTGHAPSRIFMPVSFASQLGGTTTLIGTSTNLLVAGLVLELGLPRIRLFDITPPGLVLAATGVIYLMTVGRFLTPVRATTTDLLETYELRDYLTVLHVGPGCPFIGKTLAASRFGESVGLQVVAIDREGRRISFPPGTTEIRAGDVLLVEGKSGDIAKITEDQHLEIAGVPSEIDFGNGSPDDGEARLAELIVPPRSPVAGSTLRQIGFRNRYGVPVLGIRRHGVPLHERLGDVRLIAGDLLLVRGSAADLQRLHEDGDLALLGALDLPSRRTRKQYVAIAIMIAVVGAAAFDVVPIMLAALAGVVAMFLTGCLKPDEAYEEVDWMVLVLLGSIIPLGIAMQKSGAAELAANTLLRMTEPYGLYVTLAALYLVTSLLTELISNNAAAVVLTPISISIAASLDASPLPFVVAVMFAASNSFMTPIGYQTNTFIYGPGGYLFSDYLKLGAPLNLLIVTVATFVIPAFFPF